MTIADRLRVGRTLYGAGLLLAPAGALSAVARMPLDRESIAVTRVLGARHLAQAALTRRGTRAELVIGAGIDALHAGSMVAVACWSSRPGHRVLAGRDARTAGLLAVMGLVAARR